jgi:hypothetical protein
MTIISPASLPHDFLQPIPLAERGDFVLTLKRAKSSAI